MQSIEAIILQEAARLIMCNQDVFGTPDYMYCKFISRSLRAVINIHNDSFEIEGRRRVIQGNIQKRGKDDK
jgi:hypothetical protein